MTQSRLSKECAFSLPDAGSITFAHLHLIGEECHDILTASFTPPF
jgi:hypothetical protein